MRRCLPLLIGSFFLHEILYSQTGGIIPTGSDTACVTGVSLYNRIAGGNKDEIGFDLVSTNDSGYVIAGHTNSFGNGGYDGLVQRINKKGHVIWSRAIGGTGNDYFYGVERTNDNGFILCGQTKSYGNTAGDVWLVKVDGSGNVVWSKKYGDGNVNGEMGFEVIALSDGGFAFSGAHRFAGGVSQSWIVRTDNLGNVIWSKQYGNSGSDESWGLTEDGNSIVVVGFYRTVFYDGYFMKLDKANGAIQLLKGYNAENRSTMMRSVRKTNSGYQVASLVMDDFVGTNEQQVIWNLDNSGNVLNVRKMAVPGIRTNSYGWHGMADGSFITVNGESDSNADIYFSLVNGSGSLIWAKKYPRSGRQVIRSIIASPEGGYTGVGYNSNLFSVADSNNIYLLKVDSVGDAGPCSGTNTSELTMITPSWLATISNVTAQGDVVINSPVITVGSVLFVPVTNTQCFYCNIPIPILPADTTCTNGVSLYNRTAGGNKDDIGFDLVSTNDSGYVIAGHTSSFGNGGYDGLVQKINKKGHVIWSKAIGGTGNDAFYGIEKTTDNGFIVCGQTKSYGNTAGDAWLVKLDGSGNILWSKKYGDGNVNGEVAWDVIGLSDGGVAFSGVHRFAGGVSQTWVVRTDNLGNVIWSRQYGNSGSDESWGLAEDGNSIVVVGFYRTSFYDGYFMKLDKSTGAIQLLRGYKAENRSTMLRSVKKTNSGYQVHSLVMDDFNGTNEQQVIWNLDNNGIVQNVRKMVVPGVRSNSYGWHGMPDGSFITVNGETGINSDIYFSLVNAAGSLVWAKKYPRPGHQVIRNIISSPEGGYTGVGLNSNLSSVADSNNVYLLKVDSAGSSGPCSGTNTSELSMITPSWLATVSDLTAQGDVVTNNPVITVGSVLFVPVTNPLCFYCLPKPTGTARPATPGDNSVQQHELRIYPNPVLSGTLNLMIDALYDDRATINFIDMNGSIQHSLATRLISQGQNHIRVDIPLRMQNYQNYLVEIQFTHYTTSKKIFIIR